MNPQLKKIFLKTPGVRNVVIFLYRINIVICFIINNSRIYGRALKWLFNSRETTNITYNLTAINDEYLAALISDITGQNYQQRLWRILPNLKKTKR